MTRIVKVINGKEYKITRAGYLYIDNRKISDCPVTPVNIPKSGNQIQDFCREWAYKNYRMI